MWTSTRLLAVVLPVALPLAAAAQQPLSAIDWLHQNSAPGFSSPVLLEPPITATALHPEINVSPLQELAQPVGLVPADVTGLSTELWSASNAGDLARLIQRVAVEDSPAMQTLLYTLLLSEARPPQAPGAAETLLLARIDRLFALGAVDPAQALVQQDDPAQSPARFERWFDATLLTGDEDGACAVLARAPHLAPDYAARIFCSVRQGDWQTAALTLEAAHALALLPPGQLDLLDRFLSPDVFEGAPPLAAPDDIDPLDFRMFEAIGERLPTASLPRAFATADLQDTAGWKAQIEASERLARVGALTPNQLLGIYTARLPAASGGVWDRVSALQQFETALDSNSPDAVAKTLLPVWAAMRAARLEVPFATLFGERLAKQPLNDPAARALAWRVRLLSPGYAAASSQAPDNTAASTFLAALARGQPDQARAPDDRALSISDGLSGKTPPPRALREMIAAGRVGEATLRTMVLFDSGARGNPEDLSAALATFCALGLMDTALRSGLQLMLLERR